MFGLGTQELILILVIVLIFFGADKIPKLAKSLGKGIGEFRKAQQEVKEELLKETEPTEMKTTPQDVSTETQRTKLTCLACYKETVAGGLYCSQCGKPFSNQQDCRFCGRTLTEGEKFCPNCGQPRNDQGLG